MLTEKDLPRNKAEQWAYDRFKDRMRFIARCLDAIADIRHEGLKVTKVEVAERCGWGKTLMSKYLKRKAVNFEILEAVGKRYAETTGKDRFDLSCRQNYGERFSLHIPYFHRGPAKGSKYKKKT